MTSTVVDYRLLLRKFGAMLIEIMLPRKPGSLKKFCAVGSGLIVGAKKEVANLKRPPKYVEGSRSRSKSVGEFHVYIRTASFENMYRLKMNQLERLWPM